MGIQQTIILGIISSVIASIVFYFWMFLLKPKFIISNELRIAHSENKDEEEKYDFYEIKIVNKTRTFLTNIDYSLMYCNKVKNGVIDAITLEPQKEKITFINKYSKKLGVYKIFKPFWNFIKSKKRLFCKNLKMSIFLKKIKTSEFYGRFKFLKFFEEDDDYAIRLLFKIEKGKCPLKNSSCFMFTFQAYHSFSNTLKLKTKIYEKEDVKQGDFKSGIDIKIYPKLK